MILFHHPAGNAFQAVDQIADCNLRWVVHEQMDVVVFTVHLDQICIEISTDFLEHVLKCGKVVFLKDTFPVFGDKDQVNMKIKNAMAASSDFV